MKWDQFGSRELTGRFFDFYSGQLELVERVYQRQFHDSIKIRGTRVDSLYSLLFSVHETGKAICILFGYYQLNECFMLARSLLEKVITYTYALFCDDAEYEGYLAYTKQRGFRALNRSITVGDLTAGLQWSGSVDLSQEPELREAVDRYTSKRGRRITRWTEAKLEDMLKTISDKGDIQVSFLMLAILGIYDDASEALHGTLYGSVFHIAPFTSGVPSTRDGLEKRFNEQFSMLFYLVGTSIHTLIQAINKVYPIQDITDESLTNLKGTKGWSDG